MYYSGNLFFFTPFTYSEKFQGDSKKIRVYQEKDYSRPTKLKRSCIMKLLYIIPFILLISCGKNEESPLDEQTRGGNTTNTALNQNANQPKSAAKLNQNANQPKSAAKLNQNANQPKSAAKLNQNANQPKSAAKLSQNANQPKSTAKLIKMPISLKAPLNHSPKKN